MVAQKKTAIDNDETTQKQVSSMNNTSSDACTLDDDRTGAEQVNDKNDVEEKADMSDVASDADLELGNAMDLGENPDPLAQALAELEQYKDRHTRLQAEWDNFRKRTANERDLERRRATANLMERLLPVIDDLERAIEHSDSASEVSLKEGIAAVSAKLCDVLNKDGLEVIDPMGEPFDANIHQAVGKLDDSSLFDETVAQVYQKGYRMGDKILRAAMVVVSQGGPKRESETEAEK